MVILLLLSFMPGLIVAKQKYAVIIGINDYQNPAIEDLRYSVADARYLRESLTRFARFQEQNVHLLLDDQATFNNIKKEIYWLGQVAKPEDVVFFYFSGHGTRVTDSDRNEEDGLDEAFCPYGTDLEDESTVIVDDEIGHWFRRIEAKEVVVVLDCCHSGGAAGRSLEDDGGRGLNMVHSGARGAANREADPYSFDLSLEDKIVICGSAADQQSYEDNKLKHGIFTYYLCEGIRGNADYNQDQDITTGELYNYTNTKTLDFARSLQKKQTPEKFGTLDDAVVVELNKQMADLVLFDKDLHEVMLNVGGNRVKNGDKYMIRKSYQSLARDLTIGDKEIFVAEVYKVEANQSSAKIIQEFFPGLNISSSSLPDYYAERLNYGTISVYTQPWSTVFLDGKEIGPTPLVLRDVSEGEHQLEFRLVFDGYPGKVQKKIVVEANKTVRVAEKFAQK